MVSDGSLQDVHDPWSVLVVVHRTEDGARLEGEHPHSKVTARHAVDLRTKVNSGKKLCRDTVRLGDRLVITHHAHLSELRAELREHERLVREARVQLLRQIKS